MAYFVIVVLSCWVLSSTNGYFTASTNEDEDDTTSIPIEDNFSLPTCPSENLAETPGQQLAENVTEDEVSRMKRRLLKKIDEECEPTTSATDDDDDGESATMLDDYVNLDLSDDQARKIEADYKWSIAKGSHAGDPEMNTFVDDYPQLSDHMDGNSENKHEGASRDKTNRKKRRILNVVITDMTNDETIIISNKNYTY